jgi:hypothetical protein
MAGPDDLAGDSFNPRSINAGEQFLREEGFGLALRQKGIGAKLGVAFPNEVDRADAATMIARPGRRLFAIGNSGDVPFDISAAAVEQSDNLQDLRGTAHRRRSARVHFQGERRAQGMALEPTDDSSVKTSEGSTSPLL